MLFSDKSDAFFRGLFNRSIIITLMFASNFYIVRSTRVSSLDVNTANTCATVFTNARVPIVFRDVCR